MNTNLATLRASASAAIRARDAIEPIGSAAWHEAHRTAEVACRAAKVEMERLARNPATRYGDWRTPADVELMLRGYL